MNEVILAVTNKRVDESIPACVCR